MREKLSLLATVVGVTLSVIRPLRCEITCAQLISSHCSLEVSPSRLRWPPREVDILGEWLPYSCFTSILELRLAVSVTRSTSATSGSSTRAWWREKGRRDDWRSI